MAKRQKISILGTPYTLVETTAKLDHRLDDCCGFCDDTTREMVVEDFRNVRNDSEAKKDLDVQKRKVMRHEIVHAFLNESGLRENSPWAQNEEIVDWIAIQGPKLYAAWEKAGCEK